MPPVFDSPLLFTAALLNANALQNGVLLHSTSSKHRLWQLYTIQCNETRRKLQK